MKSLGARLGLVLVTAIVLVVITSSFAASLVMRGPRPETTMEPAARQLMLLAELTEREDNVATLTGLVVDAKPAAGTPDIELSNFMTEAMRRVGGKQSVIASRREGAIGTTASIQLDNGLWISVPMPEFGPPPGGWKILVGWLTLIVAGSVMISIFAASKIIKPLRLLEQALAEISWDGTLPHMPETGPAEVRVTARALNRLSARLKATTESRMRLVAAAGHDLRTPMTRMRLRAEFIADDTERTKWLNDIEELDQIADSAIGLVREEVDRDGSMTVRLDQIICSIVQELGDIGLAVERGVVQPVTIIAGPLALTRALRNLLINAATHGETGTVHVTESDGEAIVTILDTGPGIPENRLDQVFEPFFRIDPARQKSFPGAGLGMAIAKEIVTRLQGEITVRNRHPHGLEQILTFKSLPTASR
jgi:signal transduction histidine kinase